MLRGRYFAGVLSLALLAGSASAGTDARVQKVLVRGTGDALEVEIQTSGAAVSPNTQAITGPDRIVVDFPGALPSSQLHALQVNQGAIKAIRSGLFFDNPPITRIVLDLTAPQSYQVSTSQSSVIVKLGSVATQTAAHAEPQPANRPVRSARVQNAALVSGPAIPSASISIERTPLTSSARTVVPAGGAGNSATATSNPASAKPTMVVTASQPNSAQPNHIQSNLVHPNLVHPNIVQPNPAQQKFVPQNPPQPNAQSALLASAPQPAVAPSVPQPSVSVSYQNGLLSIQAERASLSQVLFEVHVKTRADIAIPAGAEQEQVVANLGPAPAKDVLSALLNGSTYNFIVVGDERALERVIISRKDPNLF
jgi:hypothetical protein